MDVIVASLGLFIIVILVMIVAFYMLPEIFGFLISIFVGIGLVSALFQYIRPELERTGDPQIITAFWIGAVLFLLAMMILVWSMTRRVKQLKRENKTLKRKVKYLEKESKK